jgi:NAD(P)-dependent dehydrogenase (short-subunit alcohol dehydrogenase family)
MGGYGASKAALNSLTRKLHFENEWLVAFPLDPGPVNTEGGKYILPLLIPIFADPPSLCLFRRAGILAMEQDTSGTIQDFFDQAGLTPEVVSAKLVEIIDNSTRDGEGGQFVNVHGGRLAW